MSQEIYFDIENKKLTFSGHETFTFRYIWLTKCVRKVRLFPDLFFRDDAIVILGVGKNMVRSMRYWGERLNLIEKIGQREYSPTEVGEKIFGEDGWDPYLEHPATLWYLHWNLCRNLETGPTWYLSFSKWGSPTFTRDQLSTWLIRLIEGSNNNSRATENSIRRDIEVFIRTYVDTSKKQKNREDLFDSPLIELGLVQSLDQSLFEFTSRKRFSLPDEIFAWALIDYWKNNFKMQKSISFESIFYGQGSPGRNFRFDENELFDRLERIPEYSGLVFDSTAGMRSVFHKTDIFPKDTDIFEKYYLKSGK